MSVTPAKAATVILLRESKTSGFELFLVRRSGKSAFMADNYVYPGGRVEEGDRRPEARSLCSGITPEAAGRILSVENGDEAAAYYVAAIRELFEEAGILLAYNAEGKLFTPAPGETCQRLMKYRALLQSGQIDIWEIIRRESITLALDQLHYYAHWITPEVRKIRFDTRFFVALLPPGQEAEVDRHETTEGLWIRPGEALEQNLAGTIAPAPPTLKTLEELSRFETVDQVVSSLHGKEMATVQPILIKWAETIVLLFPWDPEYEQAKSREIEAKPERMRLAMPFDNMTRVIFRDGRYVPYVFE